MKKKQYPESPTLILLRSLYLSKTRRAIPSRRLLTKNERNLATHQIQKKTKKKRNNKIILEKNYKMDIKLQPAYIF